MSTGGSGAGVPVAPAPDERQSFTSWKLDLLTAINLDPAVRAEDMRLVVYLLQGLNQRSRSFNVSDETMSEELHCRRQRLTEARKRLEQSRWLKIERGRRRGEGSWYEFDDSGVEQAIRDRDDRSAIRTEKRADQERSETKTPSIYDRKSGHKPKPVSASMTADPVIQEPIYDRKSGSLGPDLRSHTPILTPIVSPPAIQDVATEPVSPSIDAGPDRSSWDADDWQALYDERAGFLEFYCGYSRAEAESMAAAEISAERSGG